MPYRGKKPPVGSGGGGSHHNWLLTGEFKVLRERRRRLGTRGRGAGRGRGTINLIRCCFNVNLRRVELSLLPLIVFACSRADRACTGDFRPPPSPHLHPHRGEPVGTFVSVPAGRCVKTCRALLERNKRRHQSLVRQGCCCSGCFNKADDRYCTRPFIRARAIMTPSLISARNDAEIRNAQFSQPADSSCEN